jgi:hypothetical protein
MLSRVTRDLKADRSGRGVRVPRLWIASVQKAVCERFVSQVLATARTGERSRQGFVCFDEPVNQFCVTFLEPGLGGRDEKAGNSRQ